jgi:hypothetical protein
MIHVQGYGQDYDVVHLISDHVCRNVTIVVVHLTTYSDLEFILRFEDPV